MVRPAIGRSYYIRIHSLRSTQKRFYRFPTIRRAFLPSGVTLVLLSPQMPSLLHIALALPLALGPVLSAPTPEAVSSTGAGTALSAYQCFTGTSFPKTYLSFEELLAINKPFISQHNDAATVTDITSAIKSVSAASSPSVPPELILAQIMQESGGELSRVGDSGKSIGLMQVQVQVEEPVRCSPGKCTKQDIVGMLQQSVSGHTGAGAAVSPGIAFELQRYSVGPALRVYNTGHLPDANHLETATGCSTTSYVSDIANRLLGLSPPVFPTQQTLQTLCNFTPATVC